MDNNASTENIQNIYNISSNQHLFSNSETKLIEDQSQSKTND